MNCSHSNKPASYNCFPPDRICLLSSLPTKFSIENDDDNLNFLTEGENSFNFVLFRISELLLLEFFIIFSLTKKIPTSMNEPKEEYISYYSIQWSRIPKANAGRHEGRVMRCCLVLCKFCYTKNLSPSNSLSLKMLIKEGKNVQCQKINCLSW
uniref:Uncharacterized protein n=1 Tax=Romanomermis culicivorax TaxID=13658 RepID=A0A915JUD9_ROMCU